MEMLLYAAVGLLVIAAATLLCALRRKMRPRRCLLLTVRDAESAEQRLRAFLKRRTQARLLVCCAASGEAAEICRRFCREEGLSYLPQTMYNIDIKKRESVRGDSV